MKPCYYAKSFSKTQLFYDIEGVSAKFLQLWNKNLRRTYVIPLSFPSFFQSRKFLKKNDMFPNDFFRYWQTKIVRSKIVLHPFYLKFFLQSRIFLKTKFVTREHFRHPETKKVNGKSWYPIIKEILFRTRNFLKKRRAPLQIFSSLWDKMFPTRKFDTHPLFHNIFLCRNLRKNWRVPTRNLSTWWDYKHSTENRDTILLGIIFFILEIFWKNLGFPYIFFRH